MKTLKQHLHTIWLFFHNRLGHNVNWKSGYCIQCKQYIGLNNLKQDLFGRIDTLTTKELEQSSSIGEK